jgi:hypothetical protein
MLLRPRPIRRHASGRPPGIGNGVGPQITSRGSCAPQLWIASAPSEFWFFTALAISFAAERNLVSCTTPDVIACVRRETTT